MKKERIGLCSNYLANLPVNSCVKLFAEPGSFKFPSDRPIIMVGKIKQSWLSIINVLGFCTPSRIRNTRFWTAANMLHASLQTCIITNMHHYKHVSLQTCIPFTDRSRYRMCSVSFTDPVPRQNITTTHPVLRVSEWTPRLLLQIWVGPNHQLAGHYCLL